MLCSLLGSPEVWVISEITGGRTWTSILQRRKNRGLAVIMDTTSLCRGSLRAAGSRTDEDLKFTSRNAEENMDGGNSRMKPKKKKEKEMFLQNKPFW